MAEGTLVVCPQCGKKYKLKEGFSAASFACKDCGATVPVGGKPKLEPKARSRRPGSAARGKSARGARGASASAAAGRRGRREREVEEEPAERGRGRGGRYSNKPASNTNAIIAVVGLVVIVGVVVAFVMSGKKDEPQPADGGSTAAAPVLSEPETPAATAEPAAQTPAAATPSATGQPAGAEPPATAQPPGEQPAATEEPAAAQPARSLGGSSGRQQWDPPADLGHLDDTPPDLRKKIDELVAVLMDPDAGIASRRAKEQLAAIGKPAFPVILGAMAKIRDEITDIDTLEERNMESSLMLGDEALREMDGYLHSQGNAIIRPGTDKKYLSWILKWHYKRWMTVLKDLPEMPGPFDPSKAYEAMEEPEGK